VRELLVRNRDWVLLNDCSIDVGFHRGVRDRIVAAHGVARLILPMNAESTAKSPTLAEKIFHC